MKIAVVGSNRGIGLELCKKLVSDKHEVFAFCRKTSSELNKVGVTKIITDFEVTSLDNMTKSLSELNEKDFDLFIHVSGILKSDNIENLKTEDLLSQFEINSVGPILTAKAFKPLLQDGSKIALLTSRMGSVSDNGSGGMYGYRMSKAALNMAGKSLALDYKDDGITVLLMHPGYVQTDMTNGTGNVTAEESAKRLIDMLMSRTPEQTGTFWHADGEELPW